MVWTVYTSVNARAAGTSAVARRRSRLGRAPPPPLFVPVCDRHKGLGRAQWDGRLCCCRAEEKVVSDHRWYYYYFFLLFRRRAQPAREGLTVQRVARGGTRARPFHTVNNNIMRRVFV